ncbi:hypothetical protein PF049_12430 [Erythrobacteraceae bacterium WH01K]|nr:hypothetical protein PF049_12430 [Erythrobacteraceae bacterium WH01K]
MNRSFAFSLVLAFALAQGLGAQSPGRQGEDAVFIDQANGKPDDRSPAGVAEEEPPQPDRTVDVYGGANGSDADDGRPVEQITAAQFDLAALNQLSSEDVSTLLAQLDETERQVLIDTVRGTDICESENQSEPIRLLCSNRLETRSAEFASAQRNGLSPEERLLGESLDGMQSRSIEGAVRRLVRNPDASDEFENQAIASVALSANTPVDAAPSPEDGTGAGEFSAETQALINAIIERFGGPGGGAM